MKFKVRDGYVVRITRVIDLGDDKTEKQELTAYAGQVIDLTADEAHEHAHKLEPEDKSAEKLLDAKTRPSDSGSEVDLAPSQLALIQAVAAATAKAVVDHLQATALATASADKTSG